MSAGLKRFYGKGDLHFVTFSCYQRLHLLSTIEARNLFVEELGRVRDQMKFRLIGYVVMTNHVHLLMSEPPQSTPSVALHKLKLSFSRSFRKRRRVDYSKSRVYTPTAKSPGSYTKGEPGAPPNMVVVSFLNDTTNMGHSPLPFAELDAQPRAFWQARFYDFSVYSRGKVIEKLNYMHANPVVRGLVKHPKDWFWSSWSSYEKNEPGLIRIDPE